MKTIKFVHISIECDELGDEKDEIDSTLYSME